MKDRFVEIDTPSGRMDTFVTHPEQDGPFPAVVVVFYDAATCIGLGKEFRDFAYQLTRRGVTRAVADFYPQISPPSQDDVAGRG